MSKGVFFICTFQVRKREKIKRQLAKTLELEYCSHPSAAAAAAAAAGNDDGNGTGFEAFGGDGTFGGIEDGGGGGMPSFMLMHGGSEDGGMAMEVDAAALEAAAAAAGLLPPLGFGTDFGDGELRYQNHLVGEGGDQGGMMAEAEAATAGGRRPVKHRHPSHRPVPIAAAAAGFASPSGDVVVPTGKRAARAAALAATAARVAAMGMDSELDGDGRRVAGPGPPLLHMSPRAVASAAASALRAAQVQAKEAAQQQGRPHAGSSAGGSGGGGPRKIMLRKPGASTQSPPPVAAAAAAGAEELLLEPSAAAAAAMGPSFADGGHSSLHGTPKLLPSRSLPASGKRKGAGSLAAASGGGGVGDASAAPAAGAFVSPLTSTGGSGENLRPPSGRIRKRRVIPDAEMGRDDDVEDASEDGGGGYQVN